ncbi:MarR family transcriptional regulator [Chitinophaga polysaccharea]|uniref:MarR family transcriptional regulator n=2 Tax=Chitinophaga polysaccharea TaxID=1293035 RepID=A0A561PXT5_9BACT|nr:MarR family transcriptional regulator [Chitinophaga polysaccharea]
MSLAKAQATVSRRMDRLNAHGIGFTDFVILHLLHQAPNGKLRRKDLAEKTNLTPSGITRLLLPIEKIGLIDREANERDARVSYVVLTAAGRRTYEEAKPTADALAEDLIPADQLKKYTAAAALFKLLGATII